MVSRSFYECSKEHDSDAESFSLRQPHHQALTEASSRGRKTRVYLLCTQKLQRKEEERKKGGLPLTNVGGCDLTVNGN
jgi:hypothetical protein